MNQDLIIQIFYLFFLSLILAVFEIQVEGKDGWAKNLPTWRPPGDKWYSKVYGKIAGEKELTGYHLLFLILILSFLHYPYFSGKIWNLSSEYITMSLFLIVNVVWDFLWFVLNPYYDFMHFWKGLTWWHKKWFLHLPTGYWFALAASAVLYTRLSLRAALLKEWLEIIALFSILIFSTIIFAILTGLFAGKQKINDQKQ